MNPIHFGANYEICLPSFRNDLARQVKADSRSEQGRLEFNFANDDEFQSADAFLTDDSQYKVSVYFDDNDDLNIATDNPLTKTRTERLLVEKSLNKLQEMFNFPEEAKQTILGQLFTNTAQHVNSHLIRLQTR